MIKWVKRWLSYRHSKDELLDKLDKKEIECLVLIAELEELMKVSRVVVDQCVEAERSILALSSLAETLIFLEDLHDVEDS